MHPFWVYDYHFGSHFQTMPTNLLFLLHHAIILWLNDIHHLVLILNYELALICKEEWSTKSSGDCTCLSTREECSCSCKVQY